MGKSTAKWIKAKNINNFLLSCNMYYIMKKMLAVFVRLAQRILQFTCNQYIRTTVENFVNKLNTIYFNAHSAMLP